MNLGDTDYISLAERLADAQIGQTGMNPAVGAVIVKNGRILGRAATANGGRPHAETQALAQAGEDAKNAAAYVTLEPCAHHGQTPPCAEALIRAGIAKVVCPWRDPNSKVDGKGFALLREAGIRVAPIHHPMGDPLRYFFTNQLLRRPYIALKIATSLDGRIALENGESQWISGAIARLHTRALRARFQGIAIGANTAIYDNPRLTTRIEGFTNPRPILFDQSGRIPTEQNILNQSNSLLITQNPHPEIRAEILNANPHDLSTLMPQLLQKGLSSILIEGGGALAASFLKAGLIDRIYHVTTSAIMGTDARPAIAALGLTNMTQIPRPELSARTPLGADTLLQYDFAHFDESPYRA